MGKCRLLILLVTLTCVSSKPKESTHDLLSRLGFDPIHRPGVNFHKKRVVDDTDKARFSQTSYNSDTDSNLFVVRLPPHHPFYSNVIPEKFENEVVAKRPMNFPSNGKPNQVYHWNIPVIKKLVKNKKDKHDSKIVHLKILPHQKEESYRYYQKLKKDGKPNIYKLKKKDHVMSIKELAEHQNDRPMHDEGAKSKADHKDSKLTHIVGHQKKSVDEKHADDSQITILRYNNINDENHILKYDKSKILGKSAHVYSPAIPKHNSFFKYFPGNGKPKSFYVIEKGDAHSRLHRLM